MRRIKLGFFYLKYLDDTSNSQTALCPSHRTFFRKVLPILADRLTEKQVWSGLVAIVWCDAPSFGTQQKPLEFGHEKPWPPHMHAGILGHCTNCEIEISTPWTDINLDDSSEKIQFDIQRFEPPIFLESMGGIQVVSFLSTLCFRYEFLPVLKNLRYEGFFQESSWRYCAFFFFCRAI